jgi:hypothetical protein
MRQGRKRRGALSIRADPQGRPVVRLCNQGAGGIAAARRGFAPAMIHKAQSSQ